MPDNLFKFLEKIILVGAIAETVLRELYPNAINEIMKYAIKEVVSDWCKKELEG